MEEREGEREGVMAVVGTEVEETAVGMEVEMVVAVRGAEAMEEDMEAARVVEKAVEMVVETAVEGKAAEVLGVVGMEVASMGAAMEVATVVEATVAVDKDRDGALLAELLPGLAG